MASERERTGATYREHQAIQDCAKWLIACLELGWKKSQLDDLERIWWEHHTIEGELKNGRG